MFFNILKIQNNLQTTKYIMIVCGLFEHASMLFRGLFQCPRFVKEGPAAVAVGRIAPTGRTAPKAPAGQSCWDDDISVTGHAYMALTKTNSAE